MVSMFKGNIRMKAEIIHLKINIVIFVFPLRTKYNKIDLLTFKDSLLAISHLLTLLSSASTVFSRDLKLLSA